NVLEIFFKGFNKRVWMVRIDHVKVSGGHNVSLLFAQERFPEHGLPQPFGRRHACSDRVGLARPVIDVDEQPLSSANFKLDLENRSSRVVFKLTSGHGELALSFKSELSALA